MVYFLPELLCYDISIIFLVSSFFFSFASFPASCPVTVTISSRVGCSPVIQPRRLILSESSRRLFIREEVTAISRRCSNFYSITETEVYFEGNFGRKRRRRRFGERMGGTLEDISQTFYIRNIRKSRLCTLSKFFLPPRVLAERPCRIML